MQQATVSIPVPTVEQVTGALNALDRFAHTLGHPGVGERLIVLGALVLAFTCVFSFATVTLALIRRLGK
jgi:hypothetical protein